MHYQERKKVARTGAEQGTSLGSGAGMLVYILKFTLTDLALPLPCSLHSLVNEITVSVLAGSASFKRI